jgi:hypothetical protein
MSDMQSFLAGLPADPPAYFDPKMVEKQLDEVEAEDLEGKILGMVEKMRRDWEPGLRAQIDSLAGWRGALEALPGKLETMEREARRPVAADLAKALAAKAKEEETRTKALLKGWKAEIKATRQMLRQIAGRGKQDPVVQAVQAFETFAIAQHDIIQALPRRLSMAERAVLRVK